MKHEMKSKLSWEVYKNWEEAVATPGNPLNPEKLLTEWDNAPRGKISQEPLSSSSAGV